MGNNIKNLPFEVFKRAKKANGKYSKDQLQAAYERLQAITEREAGVALERENKWAAQEEEIPDRELIYSIMGVPTNYDMLELVAHDTELLTDLANIDIMMPLLMAGDEAKALIILQHHIKYLRDSLLFINVITTPTEEAETQRIITPEEHGEKITANILNKSTPEQIKDAKLTIRELLFTAAHTKEVVGTQEGQLLIKVLYGMWKTLQQEPDTDKLQLFLKRQVDYLTIHRPSGLIDLLGINGNPTQEPIIRELGRVKFNYTGRFGEREKKILRAIDLWLAENNYNGAKQDLNTYAVLPLKDTMRMLGMAVTPDNVRQFKSRLMSKKGGILQSIQRGHIDIDDGHGTGLHAEVGTGSYSVSIPRDQIIFQVSDAYASYQNTAPLGQYHSATLYLKGLAFIIADKLQDQYFRYGNRSRRTNNILSIKKILEFLEDELPSYETVSRGHWVDRIREPIEEALNQIQAAGLFNWEYCKKGLGEVSPQEIATRDYRKWAALYITYKLIPAEPYTEEQIERRQQRIEEAKQKKLLKDAQTIVKADRIEKRKLRKNKKGKGEKLNTEQPEEQEEV